ncbi:MAG: LysR substrate-binding domain-containing protein [Christensenellales bacterium]
MRAWPAAGIGHRAGFRRGERSGAGGCHPRVAAGCAAFRKASACSKQELCMADFAPYRLVLLNSSPHVIGSLERQCAAAGCAPQIMLDGGAWGQALELVAKANYVSFCLPPKTMKEEKLVTRPVRDLDLTINFNMAVLSRRRSPPQSEFVDYGARCSGGK